MFTPRNKSTLPPKIGAFRRKTGKDRTGRAFLHRFRRRRHGRTFPPWSSEQTKARSHGDVESASSNNRSRRANKTRVAPKKTPTPASLTSAALLVPFSSHLASPAALSLSIFSTATSFCSLELILVAFCGPIASCFTPNKRRSPARVERATDRHGDASVQKRRWRRRNRARYFFPSSVRPNDSVTGRTCALQVTRFLNCDIWIYCLFALKQIILPISNEVYNWQTQHIFFNPIVLIINISP